MMDGPLNASRYHQAANDDGQSRRENNAKSNRSRSRSRDRQMQDRQKDCNHRVHRRIVDPAQRSEVNKSGINTNATAADAASTNKTDPNLPLLNDDPRSSDPSKRISKKALSQIKGRNTESFHAASTFVRPDLRIQIGSSRFEKYNKKLKHDDVVIVPELFGSEDDWSTYYKLVEEMREIQQQEKKQQDQTDSRTNNSNQQINGRNNNRRHANSKSEWIAWHEGAHLISKKPDDSQTYQSIIKRLCDYFNIDTNKPVGTRFNWYRDSNDWKPFHHDSAAFNPQRAKSQNITIGASFGAMRELAFIRAKPYARINDENNPRVGHHDDEGPENKCKLYFPQNNNGVFSFGRDANILWKHGINALPPSEQDGRGRISIILWGYAKDVIEEEGSPPLLGSDGKGPHAAGSYRHDRRRNDHRGGGNGRDGNNRRHDERRNEERRYDGRRFDDRRYDERRFEDRGHHRGRGGRHENHRR